MFRMPPTNNTLKKFWSLAKAKTYLQIMNFSRHCYTARLKSHAIFAFRDIFLFNLLHFFLYWFDFLVATKNQY